MIPIIKAAVGGTREDPGPRGGWGPHKEWGYLFLLESGLWEEALQDEEEEAVEQQEVLLTAIFFSWAEVWPSGAGGVEPASLPWGGRISKEAAGIKKGKVTFTSAFCSYI